MKNVAVVIPFYQREPGILKRALLSVFSQDLPNYTRIKIVIVDDASPFSLSTELASVEVPKSIEIVTLARENGGPGAARNTALDFLDPTKIDFVAFLDSDDEWKQHHLRTALTILGDDGDFYFCDNERPSVEQSSRKESKRFQIFLDSQNKRCQYFPLAEEGIMQFRENQAFLCFVEYYLAQTSTVVYRFVNFLKLRFDPTLRYAGEDHMFWLGLASHAEIVRFSTQINVVCGQGVNIYFSVSSWDHEDALRQLADQLTFYLRILAIFNPTDKRWINSQIWLIQKRISRVVTRQLRLNRTFDFRPLFNAIRIRPRLLLSLPVAAFDAFRSSKWITEDGA